MVQIYMYVIYKPELCHTLKKYVLHCICYLFHFELNFIIALAPSHMLYVCSTCICIQLNTYVFYLNVMYYFEVSK